MFKMNNTLNIVYDEETTKLMEDYIDMIRDYELVLWNALEKSDLEHPQKVQAYKDDIVRTQLHEEMLKIKNLSIPIRMEIISFDKED